MMKMQSQNYRKGWLQRGALSQEAGYVEASEEAEVKTRLGKGWEGHMEAGGHVPVIRLRGQKFCSLSKMIKAGKMIRTKKQAQEYKAVPDRKAEINRSPDLRNT